MKRLNLIPTLLTLVTSCCFASDIQIQDSSNVVTVRDHLLGIEPEWQPKIIQSYDTGQPQEVEYYEEDESDNSILGKKIFYFENGIKKEESDFGVNGKEKGLHHGLSVKWHSNGIEEEIIHYKEGKNHGSKLCFFETGSIKSKETFQEGKSVGVSFFYFSNGTKSQEVHYDLGDLHGESWEYYHDGKRKSLQTYENDILEGYAYEWHINGVISSKSFYRDGVCCNDGKNPAVVKYDEFHAIIESQERANDKLDGMTNYYYPCGQEKERQFYTEGNKTGAWIAFFENGGIRGEEYYENDLPINKHWMKYENGKTFSIAEFNKHGTTKKPVQVFSPEGVLIKEFSMKDGKYNGKYTDWYPSGVLKLNTKQNMGSFNGEVARYYESGMPSEFSNYVNGVMHGKSQKWHDNGVSCFKAAYDNGEYNGEVTEWYENGELKNKEFYTRGEPDGNFQHYDHIGTLISTSTYSNGKLVGSVKEYNEQGDLIFDASYKEGKLHGTIISYFDIDKPHYRYEYCEGKKHGKAIEYWESGEIKFQAFYKNGKSEGLVQAWYKDGAKYFVRFYNEGVPVGEQKYYFPSNVGGSKDEPVLNKSINYDSLGRLHLEQKVFFPSEKISSLLTYENGLLNGLKSIWSENDEILHECWYEKGKLEGKFLLLNQSGQLIICYYEQNKKHGPFERYYPENPKFGKVKAMEVTYHRGKLEGELREFNEAGLKVSSCTFKNGSKEGSAYVFDTRGLLVTRIQFVANVKQGEMLQYFANGSVYKVTPYENDQIHGEQISYFVNGKKASSVFYSNDVLDGLSKSWNENGILVFEGVYLNGRKEGKFNKYYENGIPRVHQQYQDDHLVLKKSYDPDGKELSQYKESE